ncbi:hypothetical protein [Paenibacillus eucommiae]|uniref:Uncharacterized protein n=1 Tax=Paenibacillus eucommiae TaxID=1355755 RepID=A0ABS4JAS1_9BACL|nr:hypothetical protein [Paenibacillus eucommiae]MBP1996933.1 hypothetical protein [Paenibacillus eucommiae]
MHNETIKVLLYRFNGECIKGEFFLFEESPRNQDMVLLQLQFDEQNLSSQNENFFNALLDIRTDLELMNIQIACYGAAKNVYPTTMQLSMGDGRKAYKHTLGHPA